jgi:transcription antitermination factor NusG
LSKFVTQFKPLKVTASNWYVLYTKPKNEKKVSETLGELGIEVYCPLVKSIKIWSDRKKKVTEPLFKSYVFVKIEESKRDDVFEAHGAVRYLFWLKKPAVVRNEEILAIQDFLSETRDESKPLVFEHMQEVKIVGGPLKDHKGKYLYNKGNKLVLQVESLGIVVKAEMHHSQVV